MDEIEALEQFDFLYSCAGETPYRRAMRETELINYIVSSTMRDFWLDVQRLRQTDWIISMVSDPDMVLTAYARTNSFKWGSPHAKYG